MKKFIGISIAVALVLPWTISAKNLTSFSQPEDPFNTRSIFDLSSRIVNGVPATLGQFPEQVFLIGYTDPLGLSEMYYCGGIVVRAGWVLTAAHCLDVTSQFGTPVLSIRAQAGFINRNNPGSTQQSILVLTTGNAYPHPNFRLSTIESDIGLLRVSSLLSSGFDLSGPYVKAAILPPSNLNMANQIGTDLIISGFGRTVTGGDPSNILYTAVIKVITRADCQAYYTQGAVPSTAFCGQDTTAPISSTCQGDSGGPASIMIGTTRTLAGIVSFGGSTCGAPPQGYTEVAKFLTWMNQYIN